MILEKASHLDFKGVYQERAYIEEPIRKSIQYLQYNDLTNEKITEDLFPKSERKGKF